jgi:D-glycero-D-manno-heptose 1,7-bisphosphate phosphatase
VIPVAGMRRAVFLDRDGVLVREIVRDGRPYAPSNIEQFEVIPEARAGLDRLKAQGFLLIVVTNQPDVIRGIVPRATLDCMHRRLKSALPLDEILVCYCLETDQNCICYKPRPGMLIDAADRWNIDLARSYMVGDRWRDVGAGRAAGCRTIFLERGYTSDRRPDRPDHTVYSLQEACELIVAGR